ncbi:MAG: alpha/beta hydrolase [Pseudomonadota bacterium]
MGKRMKRLVRTGRARLCVEDSVTRGPALVCLHAGVCDRRMWAPQAVGLQTTHRVLAYDRRGFGETRYAPEPHSRVDDLLAVLDDAGIERAVLMGCSQGGRLALDAVLAHPDRVSALVLVACSVSGAPDDASGPFAPTIDALVAQLEAADARGDRAALNELEAQAWLDGPAQPAGHVGGALRELFLDMNGMALAAPDAGEVVEPPSAWDRLDQIRVPTLIVWGGLDFPHYGPRMRVLAQRIPNAQSFVMDGVAHLPGLENPAVFNPVVAGFLASIR